MLGTRGARRLVNQFRIAPGEQAVVVTSDDAGIEAALDLADGRRGRRGGGRHPRGRRATSACSDAGIEHLRRVSARAQAQGRASRVTAWSWPAAVSSARSALRPAW